MMLLEQTATYVGSARVIRVEGAGLLLRVGDQEVSAVPAFPYPYRPLEGDDLLAAGSEEGWYAVGVIRGRGKTVFATTEDLRIHSSGGELGLTARKGVRLRAPKVEFRADLFRRVATVLRERFEEAVEWVDGLWRRRSGNARIEVEEKESLRAREIEMRADRDVSIDGEQIHLG